MGGEHALGIAGRPRSHQDLGHRIGTDLGQSGFDIGIRSAQQPVELERSGIVAVCDQLETVIEKRKIKRIEKARIFGKDHRGADQALDMVELHPRGRDEGILLGHGHNGGADILGGERKKAVIDRISRNHKDRRIGAKALGQKRRGQGTDHLEPLGIGDFAPTLAAPLGNHDGIGRFSGPFDDPINRPIGNRFKREICRQDERPVGARFLRDIMLLIAIQSHPSLLLFFRWLRYAEA